MITFFADNVKDKPPKLQYTTITDIGKRVIAEIGGHFELRCIFSGR